MTGQTNLLNVRKAALNHVKGTLIAPSQFVLTDWDGNRINVGQIQVERHKVVARYDTVYSDDPYRRDSITINKYSNLPYDVTIIGDAMNHAGGYEKIIRTVYVDETGGYADFLNVKITTVKKIDRRFVKPYIPPTKPEFIGGDSALNTYIKSNLRYPIIAEENGIQGRVILELTIAPDGKVSSTKTVKGVDVLLDKEAVRLARNMPLFKPSYFEGKPTEGKFTVMIPFKLQ